MQVTVHLNVDGESLFKEIKKSVLEEIEHARGKKAKESNVHAGYSFKKYLRDKHDAGHAAQVTIKEWDPPRIYSSSITTMDGTTVISYEAIPAEGGGIDVTYTEVFEGVGAVENVSQKTLGAIKTHSAKRKIERQLHNMEATILADQYAQAGAEV